MQLCQDVYGVILLSLDFRSIGALGSTCWAAYNAQHSLTTLKLGNVTLSPMQATVRDRISGQPKPRGACQSYIYVCAPMGFGKTIAAIASVMAAPKDDRFVIYVPAKARDTWNADILKVFGIKTSPPILVAGREAHKRRIRAACAESAKLVGTSPKEAALLLPGVKGIVVTFGCSDAEINTFLISWGTRYIIDEAHTVSKSFRRKVIGMYCNRYALLSANEPAWTEGGGGNVWEEVRIHSDYMRDIVPSARLNHVAIKPCPFSADAYALACPGDKRAWIEYNLAEYRVALVNIFVNMPGRARVVIYLPDGAPGDMIEEIIDNVAPGWHQFRFVSAVSRLKMFEQTPGSVLLIRETNSEAINILGSHLIVVRPDWVSAARYMQLIGRVLRPTNENKAIEVYLVAPTGTATQRVHLYEALRSLRASGLKGLDDGVIRCGSRDLQRMEITLRLCGSAVGRASPCEYLAAAGLAVEVGDVSLAEALFGAWQKETATVSRYHMSVMLGMPPGEIDARPSTGAIASASPSGSSSASSSASSRVGPAPTTTAVNPAVAAALPETTENRGSSDECGDLGDYDDLLESLGFF